MLKIFLFEKLGFFGKYKKLFGWATWVCQLPDDRFVQIDMVILFMKLFFVVVVVVAVLLLLLASMQSLLGGNLFYGWVRWVGQVIDLLNGRENFFRWRTWFFGYEKEIFLEEMDPCVWARWVGQTNPFLTTILDH